MTWIMMLSWPNVFGLYGYRQWIPDPIFCPVWLSETHNQTWTPYEVINANQRNVVHFEVVRCPLFVHKTSQRRNRKLDETLRKVDIIEYCKGYTFPSFMVDGTKIVETKGSRSDETRTVVHCATEQPKVYLYATNPAVLSTNQGLSMAIEF